MIDAEYEKILNQAMQKEWNVIIDIDKSIPSDKHITFLKKKFDIDNIHALSDNEYQNLCDELDILYVCELYTQEKANSADPNNFTELSELGNIVSELLAYLTYFNQMKWLEKMKRKIEKHKKKMMKRNRMH